MSALNRYSLAQLPTPLYELSRLEGNLGGPRLFIKRDDLTGLGGGGNKVRKLEYLVADALAQGADTLVTSGAVQSNHARQTAAAAARVGLRCVLVLSGLCPSLKKGNIWLDQLFGAQIRWTGSLSVAQVVDDVVRTETAVGRTPYVIPYGGSSPIGAAGYVYAMEEMMAQAGAMHVQFDRIIFASSSGGTQAGLLVGAWLSGYEGEILGISVDKPADDLRRIVLALAPLVASAVGYGGSFDDAHLTVCDSYLGEGYAHPGSLECEAIQLMARTEGLLVDPVYTGRALGGLIDLIRTGKIGPAEAVLFWHTGGIPALYAFDQILNP